MGTKPNIMLHCPLCAVMDIHKQTTSLIDIDHIILNCGNCESKTMIVRLR